MTTMQYQNKSGRSGIKDYEFTQDGVNVTFKNGSKYHYPNEGNDIRQMETLHGLLNHGEYANRAINIRNPKFTKLSGPEGEPDHDTRPYPKHADSLAQKALSRMKDVTSKFTDLKNKAMTKAGSFKDWLSARMK
jgi:hypothetical protein